jgi:hypothetical protein
MREEEEMNIRSTLFFVAALATAPASAAPALVYMTSGCGCCLGWIEHLEEAGFEVTSKALPMGLLMKKKLDAGLTPDITSCHTAEIDGYVFEGHVPTDLVTRFLGEKPDAIGLAVPGMPMGSPGMGEVVEEPYDVLLVRRDGTTEAYATILPRE